MSDNPKTPPTVEAMADAIEHIFKTYSKGELVPYEDSIIPTHEFFLDLCQRLLAVEHVLSNDLAEVRHEYEKLSAKYRRVMHSDE
jgi:hypothetical protein